MLAIPAKGESTMSAVKRKAKKRTTTKKPSKSTAAKAKGAKKKTVKAKAKRKPTRKKAKPINPSKPLKNRRHECFASDIFSGMNASDAYRNNYSTSRMKDKSIHENASHLHAKVRPRIEWLQSQVASDRIMTKIEIAEMYSDICRTRHTDFLTHSADGVWFHDIGEETLNQVALKKVKTRIVTDKDSGTAIIERQFDEVELESKVAAGKALSELMGYNKPTKMEHTGKDGKPIEAKMILAIPKEIAKALG